MNVKIQCPHCHECFDALDHLTATEMDAIVRNGAAGLLTQTDSGLQALRLELLEKQKLICDVRTSILDLQLQVTRGSQQRTGEVLEEKVFDELRAEFREDEITRV